jgi:hypothetical protein
LVGSPEKAVGQRSTVVPKVNYNHFRRWCGVVSIAAEWRRPAVKVPRVRSSPRETLGRRKERWSYVVVLRGERVLLRPGRPEDADRLVRIRNGPEIARRWGGVGIEEGSEGFIGTDEGFVIEADEGGRGAYGRRAT